MFYQSRQLKFMKREDNRYGGIFRNTRKGRSKGRPISTRHSMHLILRSSQARGELSFSRRPNAEIIEQVLKKFSDKYGVRLIKVANVGNHLHIHIKLAKRIFYAPFIRAVTAAIAVRITKCSRMRKLDEVGFKRFWDYRPYTRFVIGLRDWIGVQDYIELNKLEGLGYGRVAAQALVWMSRKRWHDETS